MKVLAIAGSPRRHGNSETLLDHFSNGLRSVNDNIEIIKVVLNEINIRPCQGCGGCSKSGICILKDDMGIIYQQVKECNLMVIASPIFFGSITAQVKTMIDRFQCWWVAKYILENPSISKEQKMKGLFLSVGGMNRYDFFEAAKKIIRIYFAVANITYQNDFFYPAIDKKGDILKHPKALNDVFIFGQKIWQDLK